MNASSIPQALWDVIACPCPDHGPVAVKGDQVVCGSCGRRFPVRDGIPVMLLSESSGSTPSEVQSQDQ